MLLLNLTGDTDTFSSLHASRVTEDSDAYASVRKGGEVTATVATAATTVKLCKDTAPAATMATTPFKLMQRMVARPIPCTKGQPLPVLLDMRLCSFVLIL